jgi:DNA-3-methyladenine glycosylase II
LTNAFRQTKPLKVSKPAATKSRLAAVVKQEAAQIKAEPIQEAVNAETKQEQQELLSIKQEAQALDVARPGVLRSALIHLISVDRRFEALSQNYIPRPWLDENLDEQVNHFKSLVLGILSQQVSGAAARSISRKFISLFDDPNASDGVHKVDMDPEVADGPASGNAAPAQDALENLFFPTPAMVLEKDVLTLKSAGLSMRKAEYVSGLAQAFQDGQFTDQFFATAPDTEIVARLTSVRGLGPWSAEMFLIFSLKRTDCLSYGDIGIQRGMAHWLGKNVKDKRTHSKGKFKYVSQQEMDNTSEPWRPFRSIGCWFMWRVNGIIDKVEGKDDKVKDEPVDSSLA